MNIFEITDESDEYHAFIADTDVEAIEMYKKLYGVEAEPVHEVKALPETQQISIYDFDGAGENVERTAKEWIELVGKKEMLYSSVF